MEIIIEFDKKSSFKEFSSIKRPDYISIGLKDENYYLIFNETNYEIKKSEVDKLLEVLGSINLQKLPKYGMGMDGVTYSLKLSNGWNSLEFIWWSDTCGQQWGSLFLFRKKIIELKNKYVEC